MYEENFNIYKALTTAEEKLYLSYSLSDTDSKTLRKSLIISKIKRIFPKIIEETKNNKLEKNLNAEKENLIEEINLKEEKHQLEKEANLRDEILTKDSTFLKLLENIDNEDWKEVFLWYNNNEPEKLESAINGLSYTNLPKKITSESIDKIYGEKMKTSVSRLETYMSCPFSYYLKYGLKLSEKEKLEVKTVDTGSFMHEVIDEFFKRLMKNEENSELQQSTQNEKENSQNIKNLQNDESLNDIENSTENLDGNYTIYTIDENGIEKIVSEIVDKKLESASKFNQTAKYKILVQRLKKVITMSLKYIVRVQK